MHHSIIHISTPVIHLNQMLKLAGVAEHGGEANDLITSGQVMVNGEIEYRKRKQLVPGDQVAYRQEIFIIQTENN